MDCIFCKIVNKEIPGYIVYEDENSLAFLDINPVNKGHILFIPKKHYDRISKVKETEFYDSFQKFLDLFEQKISNDYNIIINSGRNAGQVVFHAHIHIIPQYKENGHEKLFRWDTYKLSKEEAEEILKKFK